MQVRIHPSSLNCIVGPPKKVASGQSSCAVAIFDEKTRQEATLYAMQTSLVDPHALLLVANRLEGQQDPDSEDDEYTPHSSLSTPIANPIYLICTAACGQPARGKAEF